MADSSDAVLDLVLNDITAVLRRALKRRPGEKQPLVVRVPITEEVARAVLPAMVIIDVWAPSAAEGVPSLQRGVPG